MENMDRGTMFLAGKRGLFPGFSEGKAKGISGNMEGNSSSN